MVGMVRLRLARRVAGGGRVVWTLGLLKVRNTAIEKAMMGEARMICSSANRVMEETHRGAIDLAEIAVDFPGGQAASGMEVSADGVAFTQGDYRKATGVLKKVGYFYVRHAQWTRRRSANRWITDAAVLDEHTMKFQVDTGQLAGEFSGR